MNRPAAAGLGVLGCTNTHRGELAMNAAPLALTILYKCDKCADFLGELVRDPGGNATSGRVAK